MRVLLMEIRQLSPIQDEVVAFILLYQSQMKNEFVKRGITFRRSMDFTCGIDDYIRYTDYVSGFSGVNVLVVELCYDSCLFN